MNENNNKTSKNAFGSDAFKLGSSQVILCAVALLIGVLINLIAGRLPAKMTKFDLSSAGFFTLSQQSESLVKNLSEPVTIYLVAENGGENDKIVSLLDKYESAGSKLKVETVDPVLHPTFTQQYTSQTLSANSLIVVCGDRFKVVDNTEIFLQDYSNYYTTGQVGVSFDGEGAVTSAISYVTTSDLPVVYSLTGHGESELSQNILNMLKKDNYTHSSLNLLTASEVPADCDALIMVGPTTDLTAHEVEIIEAYMERGGSLVLFANVSNNEKPNLDTLLAAYGLQLQQGLVFERGSANCYAGSYYQYLMPNMAYHAVASSQIEAGERILMPVCLAVGETDSHRSSLRMTELLTTTRDSYIKSIDKDITTAEKEPGDVDGPFCVGMLVEEELMNGTAHLAVYTTSAMLDESVDYEVNYANSNLFMSTLGWMCQHEQSMSIHAKPVDAEILVIPAKSYNILSIAIVLALPLTAIAMGAVVTLSRRKK